MGGSTTVTANTPNALTFNNGGSGGASGTTFNGGSAQTISYNTIGAPSVTGTGASGTWGINVTGNAATATNGIVSTGSYANPSWITSILGSIVSGAVASATTATTSNNIAGGLAGSLPYQTGAGATSFLGLGTTNYVLTAGASAPQYVAQSTLSVGSAATATSATTATNIAGGAASQIPYQTGSGATSFIANGTSGQVLTSNGSSVPTWVTPTAYATVTDDTTTNAVRYPLFANQTTGNLSTEYVSSTKLQFTPSTGTLAATVFSGAGTSLTGTAASLSIGGTAAKATNVVGGAAGSLPYQSAADTTAMLALGTSGYVLTAGASAPAYVAQSTLSVGNATNATNVAVTDDTSTATDMYLSWVTSTSGNLTIKVSSTKLKFNPSTGVLTATGGVTGGTF